MSRPRASVRWSRRVTALAVLSGLSLVLATACSSEQPAAVDFDPSFPATAEQTSGAAPAIDGVPPCPESLPAAPRQPGETSLPDATFACVTKGPAVHLSGLRGTPTVITIWASWCAPCREEFPYFVSLQERAQGKVRVLGIDVLDRPTPALAAIEDFGMNFPSVSDPKGTTKPTIGYPGPPVTLFVDAKGVVTAKKLGQLTSQQQLDDLVQQNLGVTVP